MPLVIYGLGMYTHPHTRIHSRTKVISGNLACTTDIVTLYTYNNYNDDKIAIYRMSFTIKVSSLIVVGSDSPMLEKIKAIILNP